jgi:hypothetical protein
MTHALMSCPALSARITMPRECAKQVGRVMQTNLCRQTCCFLRGGALTSDLPALRRLHQDGMSEDLWRMWRSSNRAGSATAAVSRLTHTIVSVVTNTLLRALSLIAPVFRVLLVSSYAAPVLQ